jgi:DNA end-binding protein Ku
MAPRPSWKGHLRLSLVSCPVRLYPATSGASRVSFNLLHKDTLNRINMRPYDAELGEVERADLVRGYEYEKGRYVVMDPEDFDRVQIESTKTIVVEQFVDEDEVDPLYLEAPYYLAPDGDFAEETFGVIREAMRQEKKVALSRVVLTSREHLIAMSVREKGFLVTTLRTADEVRSSEEIFQEIEDGKPDKEMLQLATQLIRQKAGTFKPETFRDRYQDALMEVIRAKIKGEAPVVAKAPETARVINLMDALKRSLAESGGEPARKPPARSKARKPAAEPQRKPAKRASGRR